MALAQDILMTGSKQIAALLLGAVFAWSGDAGADHQPWAGTARDGHKCGDGRSYGSHGDAGRYGGPKTYGQIGDRHGRSSRYGYSGGFYGYRQDYGSAGRYGRGDYSRSRRYGWSGGFYGYPDDYRYDGRYRYPGDYRSGRWYPGYHQGPSTYVGPPDKHGWTSGYDHDGSHRRHDDDPSMDAWQGHDHGPDHRRYDRPRYRRHR